MGERAAHQVGPVDLVPQERVDARRVGGDLRPSTPQEERDLGTDGTGLGAGEVGGEPYSTAAHKRGDRSPDRSVAVSAARCEHSMTFGPAPPMGEGPPRPRSATEQKKQ